MFWYTWPYTYLEFAIKQVSDYVDFEIVKLLIDAGANLNVTDQDGDSPLTLARENNHADVVKILEENGAQ